ncbi:MAG: hypothetical protein HOQ30_04330 [Gemmatimonadaceae bacterium]|nr:hypothetical protein [Gemmatimonadaceae bacterium]
MAGATPLRAVKSGEKPPRRARVKAAKPKTLVEAIEGGDYLEILEAQRRDVVAALPAEKGPAKAALHRQLSILSKEIRDLKEAAVDGEGSVVANTEDEAWDGTGY